MFGITFNTESAAIITAFVGVGSLAAGYFIKHWQTVRGTQQAEKKENNQQAIEVLKELVNILNKELDKIKSDYDNSRIEYIKTREENAEMRVKLKMCEENGLTSKKT